MGRSGRATKALRDFLTVGGAVDMLGFQIYGKGGVMTVEDYSTTSSPSPASFSNSCPRLPRNPHPRYALCRSPDYLPPFVLHSLLHPYCASKSYPLLSLGTILPLLLPSTFLVRQHQAQLPLPVFLLLSFALQGNPTKHELAGKDRSGIAEEGLHLGV